MQKIIDEYRTGYNQLVAAIQGITEQELNFKPSPTSWSIKEILIHVVDAELVHIHRMKAVLSEDNPLLTAFDQDAWSTNLKYVTLDHNLYLLLFKTLRDSFVPTLESLSNADFTRIATHSSTGTINFEQILIHANEHVVGHIEQIGRVKAAFPR